MSEYEPARDELGLVQAGTIVDGHFVPATEPVTCGHPAKNGYECHACALARWEATR